MDADDFDFSEEPAPAYEHRPLDGLAALKARDLGESGADGGLAGSGGGSAAADYTPTTFQAMLTLKTHELPRTVLPTGHSLRSAMDTFVAARAQQRKKERADANESASKPSSSSRLEAPAPPPATLVTRQRAARNWSEDETRVFFEALEQCGTNLSFISAMIPGRHRDDVRKKLALETRTRPQLVQAALDSRDGPPLDVSRIADGIVQWRALEAPTVAPLTQEEQDMLREAQVGSAGPASPVRGAPDAASMGRAGQSSGPDAFDFEFPNFMVAADDDFAFGDDGAPDADALTADLSQPAGTTGPASATVARTEKKRAAVKRPRPTRPVEGTRAAGDDGDFSF